MAIELISVPAQRQPLHHVCYIKQHGSLDVDFPGDMKYRTHPRQCTNHRHTEHGRVWQVMRLYT